MQNRTYLFTNLFSDSRDCEKKSALPRISSRNQNISSYANYYSNQLLETVSYLTNQLRNALTHLQSIDLGIWVMVALD